MSYDVGLLWMSSVIIFPITGAALNPWPESKWSKLVHKSDSIQGTDDIATQI